MIALLAVLGAVFKSSQGKLPYAVRQTVGIMIFLGITVGTIVLFVEDSDAIRYSLAGYYFIGAFCQIGLLAGVKFVKNLYFVHDLVCGHIIFIPIFIMAGLQLPHHIQTWLLYHNALSSDVVVSDILRYAQKSQKSGGEDDEDLIEQVSELRKLLQKQEDMLANAGLLSGGKSTVKRNESTDAFAEIFPADTQDEVQIQQPILGSRMAGRAVSMTGLDVWGPMTMGVPDDGKPVGAGDTGYQTRDYSTQSGSKSGADFKFSQPSQMPPR